MSDNYLPINYSRIRLLAIVIIIVSGVSFAILVTQYSQQQVQLHFQQGSFSNYNDSIHTRYIAMLDHNFIPTTTQMYRKLFNIINETLSDNSSAKELSNLKTQYILDTRDWHGVPALLEAQKRSIIDNISKEFNNSMYLRYTMIVTKYPDCRMYILEPKSTQATLNRTVFTDHPWCTDLHQRETTSDATEPYWSDTQGQQVSTVIFPCCSIQNNKSIVTSYVGATLGLANITNQLLFKRFDLDPTQTKFMIFAYNTNHLFEPTYKQIATTKNATATTKNATATTKNATATTKNATATTKNAIYTSLSRTDEKVLRDVLYNQVNGTTNTNHITEVHLGGGKNYVVYWTHFDTTDDAMDRRHYSWYGVLMDKDASTVYDSYNSEFSFIANESLFDIILIIFSIAGLGCAAIILWFNHKWKEEEELGRKVPEPYRF